MGGVGGGEECAGRESEVWVRVLEGEQGESLYGWKKRTQKLDVGGTR